MIQSHHFTLLDLSKAIFPHPLRVLFVFPAGVVGRDVNPGVRLVPGGEIGVRFRADGAQGASDEVEDGADFGLAFCGTGCVSCGMGERGWDGIGRSGKMGVGRMRWGERVEGLGTDLVM